jgi:hypothetical protein
MTNREWLASLSDEQLIKAIRSFKEDPCCMCEHSNMWGDDCACLCFDGQVEWLNMEHKDDWEERKYWYCT